MHINQIIQYLSFSFWLINLVWLPSKFIHVIISSRISLFYSWIIFTPYMCVCFFIYSLVIGLLGCFHILTIVNSATMNIPLQDSGFISFGYYIPRIGIDDSYGSSINFLKNLHTAFHSDHTNKHFLQQYTRVSLTRRLGKARLEWQFSRKESGNISSWRWHWTDTWVKNILANAKALGRECSHVFKEQPGIEEAEIILLSETSHRDKYHMISLICGF